MIPYETKKKTCVPPRLSIQQICNGIKGNPTDKVRKKEELQAGRKLCLQERGQHKESGGFSCREAPYSAVVPWPG